MNHLVDFALQRRARLISRYWDSVSRGRVPRTDLTPDLASYVDLIDRLHRTWETNGGPMPTGDPVLNRLLAKHREMNTMPMSTVPALMRNPSSPLAAIPVDRRRPSRRASWLPVVATIAVVIGLLVAGLDRFDLRGRVSETGPGAAVIFAPSTPETAASTDAKLFDLFLPADVVPAGAKGSMLISRATIAADSQTSRTGAACCPGAKVYSVLSGTVSVIGSGPMQRIAAGSNDQIQQIAANTPVSLAAGDVLIVRNEYDQMWTAGHTDVDILTAIMTGGSSPGGYDPAEWSSITNSSSDDNTLALPGGPYRLTLRQVDGDAATEIPLPANGVSQLGMLKDGEATVGRASDGTLSIVGATKPGSVLIILTLSTAEPGSGTPVALPGNDQ
jgi:hypothetical protein